MELARLFRGVPMVLSTPSQPRGVVSDIGFAPQLVIATPGAEPRVRGESPAQCEYRAVAILDAWTSLYASGIDADVDTLTGWMRAVSLCAPRTRGGQALLIGETDPVLARSLMLWNSPMLAQVEVEDRAQTALPPVFAAACVWADGCGLDDVETNRRVGRRRHGHHRHDRRYDAVRLGAGADSAATHHRFT